MGLETTNKCLWCSEVDYIEHAFLSLRKTEKNLEKKNQTANPNQIQQARGNRKKSSALWCIKNRNRGCRDEKEGKPYCNDSKTSYLKT